MTISDRELEFLIWGFGVIIGLLVIPFFPRQEVRTPIRAVGMAVVLGFMWPLLLLFGLKYVPWWYWLKWVEYREFLITTKTEELHAEFNSRWNKDFIEKYPDAYQRNKEFLYSEISNLEVKANKLYSRRHLLESRLRK